MVGYRVFHRSTRTHTLVMSAPLDSYQVLTGRGMFTLREKASKFIGLAFPVTSVDAFKAVLSAERKAHHSARHWCHAYVLGDQGEVHRSNDDGEPSGTAGRPILRHIQGAGLTYTGVIVVRYFGGTLLGKGGLVQAYGTAAAGALTEAPKEVRALMDPVTIQCTHAAFDSIRADVLRSGGRIMKVEHLALCDAVVLLPRSKVMSLMLRWTGAGITCARQGAF